MPVIMFEIAKWFAVGGAAVIAWERFGDKPDTTIIQGPTWKEYAAMGLAAAGGFYLARQAFQK